MNRVWLTGATAVIVVLLTALALRATATDVAAGEDLVPYYEDATFTPQWAPVAHRVGPFALRAHTGAAFTDADLLGQVHVVSFLFTQCPNICPRLTASLQTVERRTRGSGLQLLSITVTPDTDTPAVLAAFAARHHLPSSWTLATGTRDEVARLARDRYFAMDDRSPIGTGDAPLLHSEKLLLIDRGGHIRGLYNGLQAADLEHLIEDVMLLTTR